MRRSVFWFVLLVLLSTKRGFAQSHSEQIDRLMRTCVERGQFSGAVLVVEKGRQIYGRGFGEAQREWHARNDLDTKFELGSLTKQFTAMLVMQQIAKGTLGFEEPVRTYLPAFRPKDGDTITLRHLLTHTAGIQRDFIPFDPNFDPYTPEKFVERLAKIPLGFVPGSKYQYSNAAYVLLGILLEKVTGKSYETLLQENILMPLGMKGSGVVHLETILPKRASGYEKNTPLTASVYNNANIDSTPTAAAGAMYATARDLHRWHEALYTEKLLPAKFRDLYFTPYLEDYACGWGVRTITFGPGKTDTVHTHTGRVTGFCTQITRLVGEHSLVVLLNNTGATRLNEMTRAILDILHDKPYREPKRALSERLGEALLKQPVEAALARYQAERKETESYYLDEEEMNNLGYAFLRAGKTQEAVAVFQCNVEAFPQSWNTHDSLGEACLKAGDRAAALTHYRRSVELNPDNKSALDVLKSLQNERKTAP